MPKPIILTETMKDKARKKFDEMLNKAKMSNGKIVYSENFDYKENRATVLLTPLAYQKTVALLTEFSDEVAWNGTVTRTSENEFTIEDILVYPQEVTGSTVSTDQEEYTKWLYEQSDEVFNNIRMQGHSHVNMSVSPSGVDDNHRKQILEQLEDDMFYIFQIWNKSLSVHTLIYDMARNILYEDSDVDVKLLVEKDTELFIADAKAKVQRRIAKPIRKKSKKQEQSDFEADLMMCGYYPHDQHELGGFPWC